MKEQRVERHSIKKGTANYRLLYDYCVKSARLYNRILYILRNTYSQNLEKIEGYEDLIKNERFISEFDLSKRMRKLEDEDYMSLPKAQCSQQTVGQVFKSMKSFYAANKEYKKNPNKFLGKPRMPKYKDKCNVIYFPNQSISIKNGEIWLNKKTKLEKIKTEITDFQQIRFIPKGGSIIMEIVYNKEIPQFSKGNAVMGIDVGVNNLAAITSDNGVSCIVNGRPLKSINQFYNKEVSKLMDIYKKTKVNVEDRKKQQKMMLKRDNKINDYVHKATRRIVEIAIINGVGTCYIGLNKGWKVNPRMKHKTKQIQNFKFFPFDKFISVLTYKMREIGCQVITINESHTSKCSFLDNEPICHHDKYVGRRVKRGLFRSAQGKYLNADINASLNMIRRGRKEGFETTKSIFNPHKININMKLMSSQEQSVEGRCFSQMDENSLKKKNK